ncbi:MAG: hypothetical protein JSS02_08655 [Planctomycetes bacterium]|nr:hypothetical protein [Planctomycetota bacterium]
MRVFLSCVLSLTLLSVSVFAADKASGKKKKLSPGDKVEVEWAGKKIKAEFVEYFPTGWLTVKFKSNGVTMTPTLPPDKVRPLTTEKADAGKGSSGAKMRTWTDKTGKYKTKAKFVELSDGEVTLETENGKKVKMALDKLSKADQDAAKAAAKEAEDNPFKEAGDDDDNPFEKGAKSADSDDGDDDDNETEPVANEADWSSVETLSVGQTGPWKLTPDAIANPDNLFKKPILLESTLKSKGKTELGFFESVDGLLISRGQSKACVVVRDGTPGKSAKVSLQMVDLAAGKASDPVSYKSNLKPVDIDSDGEHILSRADQIFAHGDTTGGIGVWKMGSKGPTLVKRFSPQDPGNIHKTAPTMAQFIDADHVLTLQFPSKLAMFQVSKAKAIYRVDLSNNGVAALSVNRKYLAAPVNNEMVIFDALTGDTLGKLPGDPGIVSALSFRPDGTQLAALSPQRLIVWDLVKGEMYRDIYFPTAVAANGIDWMANGYLLVSGQNLIDLDLRVVLWRYQHQAGNGFSHGYGEFGGNFYYALTSNDRKERALFQARLPHEAALKAAAGLNADQLLALKPGTTVSINMQAQGAQDEIQKAYQALTAQLTALGINVGNGAQVTLQATTEQGKTQEISYRSFGRLGNEKANVTEYISRLKIVENGKVLWETSITSGAPHFLQMKDGESLQQALAPYQKPNIQFFSSVKLPQYLARPTEGGAYGASNLTPQGIESAPLVSQQGVK